MGKIIWQRKKTLQDEGTEKDVLYIIKDFADEFEKKIPNYFEIPDIMPFIDGCNKEYLITISIEELD